ncbi:MAG: cation:dicarboxylase symporter family transporter [Planctomycetes bacterium]|nr:cation:dicarboxylase symporter family transporter [Planctomycetota bacterium]
MQQKRRIGLTSWIFIGLALGLAWGSVIHYGLDANHEAIEWTRVLSRMFLVLIKMLIAPLLFGTLVGGLAGAGHARDVGRVGLKAILYFEVVTTLALIVGLVMVNWVRPGDGVNLPVENTKEALEIAGRVHAMSAQDHIVAIFPTSIFKAMAENSILQVVAFSLVFAFAVVAAGKRAKPVVDFADALTEVMFKLTGFVMLFAPIGVGAAIAVTVGGKGLGVLKNLGLMVGTLYMALAVFGVLVLLPIAFWIRLPFRRFWQTIREPAMLAFTTTSSEAALPKAMQNLQKFGCPRSIVGLVLPLGYSFNLDGTTLYLSLATIFVAQAANVELSWQQQLLVMLTLMLTSKGVAAVPRASLVVLSGTLVSFGLPLEGVALILGVDELMDMGRTATNLVGNCLATAAVSRWEGHKLGVDEVETQPIENST